MPCSASLSKVPSGGGKRRTFFMCGGVMLSFLRRCSAKPCAVAYGVAQLRSAIQGSRPRRVMRANFIYCVVMRCHVMCRAPRLCRVWPCAARESIARLCYAIQGYPVPVRVITGRILSGAVLLCEVILTDVACCLAVRCRVRNSPAIQGHHPSRCGLSPDEFWLILCSV